MNRRGKYEIVYLDPPWYRTPCGTAKTPYKTMTWEELHAFDLGRFLAPDCVVFVWTTGPTHLQELKVLSTWCERFGLHEAGIAYKWIKTKRDGVPALPPHYAVRKRDGQYYVTVACDAERVISPGHTKRSEASAYAWDHWQRSAPEWARLFESLLAQDFAHAQPIGASGPRPRLVKQLGEDVIALTSRKRGRVFPLLTESQSQWVFAPKPKRGEHSSKPPIVRERIVGLLGDRPRIELFARGEGVEGWHGWGDEYLGKNEWRWPA